MNEEKTSHRLNNIRFVCILCARGMRRVSNVRGQSYCKRQPPFSALFYSSEQIAHRGFCKRFENPHFAERGLSFSITKIDLWSCANRRTIFREGFESLTLGVLFFSPRSFSLNNVYLIMVSIVGATFPALRKLTDFQ